jgi:hypothetical protein
MVRCPGSFAAKGNECSQSIREKLEGLLAGGKEPGLYAWIAPYLRFGSKNAAYDDIGSGSGTATAARSSADPLSNAPQADPLADASSCSFNYDNSRNGTRSKTVLTEIGPVEIDVPRDLDASFTPNDCDEAAKAADRGGPASTIGR